VLGSGILAAYWSLTVCSVSLGGDGSGGANGL
jgi:hypothetical protein